MDVFMAGLGGAVGSMLRAGLTLGLASASEAIGFPIATMVVNFLGCFIIGLFQAVLDPTQANLWAFLVTGFLGGLTTFSTFGLQTYMIMSSKDFVKGVVNVVGHIWLGLASVWLGHYVGNYSV